MSRNGVIQVVLGADVARLDAIVAEKRKGYAGPAAGIPSRSSVARDAILAALEVPAAK